MSRFLEKEESTTKQCLRAAATPVTDMHGDNLTRVLIYGQSNPDFVPPLTHIAPDPVAFKCQTLFFLQDRGLTRLAGIQVIDVLLQPC